VLSRRPDGYHELRTTFQTIALSDWLTLTPADGPSLVLRGAPGSLAAAPPEANLAYRAAARLRRAPGPSPQEDEGRAPGARIELEKNVPVAAGLGGGSSDAAAVLRGLRVLWRLPMSDGDLASIARELGADVPFFLRGGAAVGSSRGDILAPLPDGPPQRLVLAWPEGDRQEGKTAAMFEALHSERYSDGSRTEQLAGRLREGQAINDSDLFNVFEEALPQVDASAARAFDDAAALGFGRPHLAGSGPAFFLLLAREQPAEPLLGALLRIGLRAVETHTLPATEAVACQEVS
jgi:4-diphosphocytidyl-2-C-methyl-D-erythritol kinase